MRMAMIGAGYVGLVSSACFADFGHRVICVDNDARRIAALKRGEIPIFEPGLADLIEANAHRGQLKFAESASDMEERMPYLLQSARPHAAAMATPI